MNNQKQKEQDTKTSFRINQESTQSLQ